VQGPVDSRNPVTKAVRGGDGHPLGADGGDAIFEFALLGRFRTIRGDLCLGLPQHLDHFGTLSE
jgi:hypothetical protein